MVSAHVEVAVIPEAGTIYVASDRCATCQVIEWINISLVIGVVLGIILVIVGIIVLRNRWKIIIPADTNALKPSKGKKIMGIILIVIGGILIVLCVIALMTIYFSTKPQYVSFYSP